MYQIQHFFRAYRYWVHKSGKLKIGALIGEYLVSIFIFPDYFVLLLCIQCREMFFRLLVEKRVLSEKMSNFFSILSYQFGTKTRPDTRQDSRGRLGRGRNAKTARNSKKLGTDGRTDRHGKG